MKFIRIICLSLALSAGCLKATVSAQTGTGYFLHTVTKGQSLYSIASMYNVSIDDIVRLNPGSREQIRAGEALKIPQTQYSNENGQQFHTIQAGETLYQLTIKYKVSAQAICKANPGLSAANFRIGQVIVIPAQDNASRPRLCSRNRRPRKMNGEICTRLREKKPFSASASNTALPKKS